MRRHGFGITAHGLVVTIAWGAMDESDARALAQAWQETFTGPPRDTLVDVTGLVLTDSPAFSIVRDVLEEHRLDRARVVARQAVVAGRDLGGAIVRGYFAAYPAPYPHRLFEQRGEALAWLGHGCCAQEIEALEDGNELIARLRVWLERCDLATVTLDATLAQLAVSARTLQRRLAEADTSFTLEVARAQVARAQRLMRDPARRLSEIARAVGCATPSTFSELFRRIAGETPSAWRRRQRATGS